MKCIYKFRFYNVPRMHGLPYILILLTLFCACRGRLDILKEGIVRELAQQAGTFAVAFEDLGSGEQILIRQHESFHAASTMKTPVMVEVFKQAHDGKFSLTDSILISNDFKSIVDGTSFRLSATQDSEQELYTKVGSKATLNFLVYEMIIASSNLATNIVIDLVGAENVTQTMRDLGAKDIQVLRGVEDTKAFDKGLNNTTTSFDLMVIFEKIAKGETVSPESSGAMVEVLLDQKFNSVIPASLPPEVKVAHKTGSITGVHHDSGIVFLPDGRKYVLVLLSKDLTDAPRATAAMAKVSAMIYAYMTDQKY